MRIPQIDSFDLCDYKTERLWVHIRAEITGCCLKISGQDLGQVPLAFFDSDEYEYWYTFNEKNTELLIRLLVKNESTVELLAENENDIKKILIEKFSGLDGCERLTKFCNQNGIKYELMTWSP
jgi:hypothetical protein